MNFIQCAGRCFIRKKSRSIFLILLLTTVFLLLLTVVSVAGHAKTVLEKMEHNFNREFVVDAQNAPGSLTLERIHEISAREDITAYRLISNAVPVEFADNNGTSLSVKTDGDNCFISPGFEHAGTLVSNVTSDSDELFSEGTLKIISGRHVKENDAHKILVHKELTDKNSLHLGDTIQLKFPRAITRDLESMGYDTSHMNTHTIQAEIIGIFESQDNGHTAGMHLSHQLYENYCYLDLETYSSVFNPKAPPFFFQAAFSAASSSDFAAAVNAVKNLDWPAGQPNSIVSDLDHYADMIGSRSSLSNLLRILWIVIILVCITLIYFLLSHGVKQRKREIGILMSLGLSRSRILMQHIAEVLLAAATAMVIAFALSRGIVHVAGEHMIAAAVKQSDGTEQAQPEQADGSPTSVSSDAAGIMLILGFLLIPVSVIAAEYPVLQKEPDENLRSVS